MTTISDPKDENSRDDDKIESALQSMVLSGNIELRRYESMLSAEVTLEGDYKGIQNDAFRILAGYIFGDNVKNNQSESEKISMTTPVTIEPASEEIAMTAPVTIEPAGEGKKWTMRFTMPSKYTRETLPTPKDERIKIKEIKGYDALAYRFSWFFGKDDLEKYSAVLKTHADKNQTKLMGLPYSAVYNSPFTLPFLRRNEVLWRVGE